jgi:GT2 family glycosyltransferase
LYPDGTIQHAGIVVGMGGLADHVYAGCPTSGRDGFAFVEPGIPRNVLALTGACLAVERRKLSEVGGFDEDFRVCGDVELCLRLHAAGYYNLYQANSRLTHHESATRGRRSITPMEKDALLAVFRTEIGGEDPFYNPNLDLRCRFPTFLEPFHPD